MKNSARFVIICQGPTNYNKTTLRWVEHDCLRLWIYWRNSCVYIIFTRKQRTVWLINTKAFIVIDSFSWPTLSKMIITLIKETIRYIICTNICYWSYDSCLSRFRLYTHPFPTSWIWKGIQWCSFAQGNCQLTKVASFYFRLYIQIIISCK